MKNFRKQMTEIMQLAWQFVKRNGFTMSEALRIAWRNYKVKAQMKSRIVKFYFQKVDGSIREAYGTLKENLIPATANVTTPYKRTSTPRKANGGASKRLTC